MRANIMNPVNIKFSLAKWENTRRSLFNRRNNLSTLLRFLYSPGRISMERDPSAMALWPSDFPDDSTTCTPQAHHVLGRATKRELPCLAILGSKHGNLCILASMRFSDGLRVVFLVCPFRPDEPLCWCYPWKTTQADRPSDPSTSQTLGQGHRSSPIDSSVGKWYSIGQSDRASLVICKHSPPCIIRR